MKTLHSIVTNKVIASYSKKWEKIKKIDLEGLGHLIMKVNISLLALRPCHKGSQI
jgi:hypothetical protein